jgi:hypothetical protein
MCSLRRFLNDNPDAISRGQTRATYFNDFMWEFDAGKGGLISRVDFFNFYTNRSKFVNLDRKFAQEIADKWRISSDDIAEFTEYKKREYER